MIHDFINLTLLLFSYETQFLTSCCSKDNICQIWAFSSERKSSVSRGQNSLISAWVSAGVIYWEAVGTVDHNLCEKSMPSPTDKDELKYLPSLQGEIHSFLSRVYQVSSQKEENQPCQPRCNFPVFEESQNTHCKAA